MIIEDKMTVEEKLKELGAKDCGKKNTVFLNTYFINNINPEYGYFTGYTVNTPITSIKGQDPLTYKFTKIVLHRGYTGEGHFTEHDEYGSNERVFLGFIRDGEELERTLEQLGILAR